MSVIQKAIGTPDIDDSTTYMPYFGFRYEFRLPTYDPTTVVVITLETVDRANNTVCYVGHSYFPLFLDRKTRDPVTEPGVQGYFFNEGFY